MIPEFKFALKDGLEDCFLPVRGDSRSTGWDVRSSETIVLHPTETVRIPLGIRCFSPKGWWLELRPRSSTFAKRYLSALYGVIDESYEGELLFVCRWIPSFYDPEIERELVAGPHSTAEFHPVWGYYDRELIISKGERIGQLVPVERQEMVVTSVTNEEFDRLCRERGLERGAGGLGSTGTK